MIGQTLSHFKITAKLGKGGMGEVYRAEDRRLRRAVALKVLPQEMSGSQERLERFRREAEALASLDHPNIVTIYSVEEDRGIHFLTMQLVEGKSLDELIPEHGLPVEDALGIATSLADALRAAHDRGVIHRDLKPANVMVDSEGRVRVLDFGLAKLRQADDDPDLSQLPTAAMTQEGVVLGTVPYMSPEQVQGGPVDHRTDIFSFGILLYEMVTGRRPFGGDTSAAVAGALLRDTPTAVTELRSDLPPALVEVLAGCLVKNPEERLQSATEVRDRLRELRLQHAAGRTAVPRPRASPTWSLRMSMIALIVLIVVAAGAIYWWFARTGAGLVGPRIESLVVLPLQNLSGDPTQDYFADGMTEALTTDLSKIGALRVISRTSAKRFKETNESLAEIASVLGVDAVVEGSVIREGDRVGITAQLVEVATRQTLWADRYERNLTSILKLQGEIAQAIAREIRITLTPGERSRLSKNREVDPATYQAYLKGMYFLNQSTREGLDKGMALLREAVERDPGNAFAYAGLAQGYAALAHSPYGSAEDFERARAAARRALDLDASIAQAHLALGADFLYRQWNFPAAKEELLQALELNPSLTEAHYHYGWYLDLFGRHDEAEAHFRKAKELDPLVPKFTAWLGGWYFRVGRYEQAMAETLESLDLAPDNPIGLAFQGRIYRATGQVDKAVATHERLAEIAPRMGSALAELAQTYATAGRLEEATALALRISADPTLRNPLALAKIYALLGDTEEAFRWLEAAAADRWQYFPWLVGYPQLKSLHEDPRFWDLIERYDLPTG